MASPATDSVAIGRQTDEAGAPKQGDVHQDVEIGAEAIDIARVEKVYA